MATNPLKSRQMDKNYDMQTKETIECERERLRCILASDKVSEEKKAEARLGLHTLLWVLAFPGKLPPHQWNDAHIDAGMTAELQRVVRLQRRKGYHISSQKMEQIALVVRETPTQWIVRVVHASSQRAGAETRFVKKTGLEYGIDVLNIGYFWRVVGEPFMGTVKLPYALPEKEGA